MRAELRRALALVVPSIWFEGFPLVVLEAYAAGTPVIASRLGSLGEIVADGTTGLLVPPNDPDALGERGIHHRDRAVQVVHHRAQRPRR